jgi:hypothetical protein
MDVINLVYTRQFHTRQFHTRQLLQRPKEWEHTLHPFMLPIPGTDIMVQPVSTPEAEPAWVLQMRALVVAATAIRVLLTLWHHLSGVGASPPQVLASF